MLFYAAMTNQLNYGNGMAGNRRNFALSLHIFSGPLILKQEAYDIDNQDKREEEFFRNSIRLFLTCFLSLVATSLGLSTVTLQQQN